MRVALYARVSSESQEARGTIGSQLEVLRARIQAEGHELVAEFCDDGYSGHGLTVPDSTSSATKPKLVSSKQCGA